MPSKRKYSVEEAQRLLLDSDSNYDDSGESAGESNSDNEVIFTTLLCN